MCDCISYTVIAYTAQLGFNGQSKFQHGAFTLYAWSNQIHEELENGQPFQIS